VHIDALAAGDRGRERWAELLRQLVAFFRSCHEIARTQDPHLPRVTDEALLVLVGGVPEVVREYVRTGRVARAFPSWRPRWPPSRSRSSVAPGEEERAAKDARTHDRRGGAAARRVQCCPREFSTTCAGSIGSSIVNVAPAPSSLEREMERRRGAWATSRATQRPMPNPPY